MIDVGSTAAGTGTDIYGGSGDDVYAVTGDSTLDGIIGPVNIHGGAGANTLAVGGSGGCAFRRQRPQRLDPGIGHNDRELSPDRADSHDHLLRHRQHRRHDLSPARLLGIIRHIGLRAGIDDHGHRRAGRPRIRHSLGERRLLRRPDHPGHGLADGREGEPLRVRPWRSDRTRSRRPMPLPTISSRAPRLPSSSRSCRASPSPQCRPSRPTRGTPPCHP